MVCRGFVGGHEVSLEGGFGVWWKGMMMMEDDEDDDGG